MQSYGETGVWTMLNPAAVRGWVAVWILLLAGANGATATVPYEQGSVYNLARLLAGDEAGREIVRYPLGCSVNTVADNSLQLLFPSDHGRFSEFFDAACVRHDLCYRHGYYTYGFSKDECDREFAGLLYQRCYDTAADSALTQCKLVAGILSLAATKFGHLSYHSSDFRVRDFGYYYEYLPGRHGRFELFWALLKTEPARVRALLSRSRVALSATLKPEEIQHLLSRFFRKKVDYRELVVRLGLSAPR